MALTIHLWAFALLPFLLLLAALFWGAPAIALVSELIGLVSGKPFPARVARQLSRLAVMGHALFWLTLLPMKVRRRNSDSSAVLTPSARARS